jgi:predicted DNA-binding transcriptional regulator YafY
MAQRQPGAVVGQRPPAKPQVRPAGKPAVAGKLFSPIRPEVQRTRLVRDVLGLITFFAQQHRVIRLIYRKLKDGSTIQRDVEPYSLRYLRTKQGGRARYFYAYDLSPPTQGIHSFRMSNILAVEGTNRTFVPRWVVEF